VREKVACLQDATSGFDHEVNLEGQSDKQRNTLYDSAVVYGRSDKKEPLVDWTPLEDVNRLTTKVDTLLSLVFWSQKERTPLYPIQGHHQEKPEAHQSRD